MSESSFEKPISRIPFLPFFSVYSRRIATTTIYNGASGRAGVSKPSSLGGGSKKTNRTACISDAESLGNGLFICLTAQLLLCYMITIFHAVPIWRSTRIPNTVFRDWTKARGSLAKWCGMNQGGRHQNAGPGVGRLVTYWASLKFFLTSS